MRTLIVAVAAATGLSLATGVAAASSADNAWIYYAHPVIAGAQEATLVGSVDVDGTCVIPVGSALPPQNTVASVDETAFNPDLCQSKVLISATDDAEDTPDSAQKDEGDAAAEIGTSANGTDAAILATRSAGYYKSYYEDPVQLDVNSVTNSTTWSWNGSSVLSSPGPVGGYHYGWFKGSGWSLKENNWQNTYTSNQTTSSSYVHYRNGTFCATIDTHTYYDRNNVHGRKDGWLLGNVNARKKGGCTSLLSFHTKLKRTKN